MLLSFLQLMDMKIFPLVGTKQEENQGDFSIQIYDSTKRYQETAMLWLSIIYWTVFWYALIGNYL